MAKKPSNEIGLPPQLDAALLEERAELEQHPDQWLRVMFPEWFQLPFADMHLELIDRVARCVREGGNVAVVMPRGCGKTTIVRGMALWAVLTGQRRYVLIAAAKKGLADSSIKTIGHELLQNDQLGRYYADSLHALRAMQGVPARSIGQKAGGSLTFARWTGDAIVFSHVPSHLRTRGAVIQAVGVRAAVRGLNYFGARPDFVLLDDPQTDKVAYSSAAVEELHNLIQKAFLCLGRSDQKVGVVATLTAICPNDLVAAIEGSKAWDVYKRPALIGTPRASDLWERFVDLWLKNRDEAVRFWQQHRAEMEAGLRAAWPEGMRRDAPSAVAELIIDKHLRPAVFAAEMQCAPLLVDANKVRLPAREWYEATKAAQTKAEYERKVMAVDVQAKILYWLQAAKAGQDVVITAYGTVPQQTQSIFHASEPPAPLRPKPGEAANQCVLSALSELVQWFNGPVVVDAGWGMITRDLERVFKDAESVYLAFGSAKVPGSPKARAGERVGAGWAMLVQNRAIRWNPNLWKDAIMLRMQSTITGTGDRLLLETGNMLDQLLVSHLLGELREGQGANSTWRLATSRAENHWLDCLGMALVLLDVLHTSSAKKPIRLSELQRNKEAV